MGEETPTEEPENENTTVLEGGVEENVYKDEDDEEIGEEIDPMDIPDREVTAEREQTPYELSNEDLAEILRSVISSNTLSGNKNEPLFDDSFSTISQTDTTNKFPKSLPQIQTSLSQEELKEMYEKLLEELRKMLHRNYSNWTKNNVLTGSLADNNKLSIMESAQEISNFKSRQNQKAEIDEYLNDYVVRKNVPDEYKNALRHRAGSLLMAKKLGDNDKVQFWGNAKEFRDLATGHDSKVGSAIDAQNNYIGRTIYDKYKNDNLSDDEYMDKIIESIKKYNPNETNFNEWQNKNSKIPMKHFFDAINDKIRSKK